MQIHITGGWLLFCLSFGLMLVVIIIMNRLSRHFYTKDVVLRKFDIMDVQWPGSPLELENLVKGIYKVPATKMKKAISALKNHLYIDFLFMPAAYGSVFLLCMKISWKMTFFGPVFFAFLAWLQLVPWVLDIIENFYLLRKIKPGMTKPSDTTYKMMQKLEILKWGIPLVAAICALSSLLYFWVNGFYQTSSLLFAGIVVVEIILFFAFGKLNASIIRRAGTPDHFE